VEERSLEPWLQTQLSALAGVQGEPLLSLEKGQDQRESKVSDADSSLSFLGISTLAFRGENTARECHRRKKHQTGKALSFPQNMCTPWVTLALGLGFYIPLPRGLGNFLALYPDFRSVWYSPDPGPQVLDLVPLSVF
jgi:hypothetical protein